MLDNLLHVRNFDHFKIKFSSPLQPNTAGLARLACQCMQRTLSYLSVKHCERLCVSSVQNAVHWGGPGLWVADHPLGIEYHSPRHSRSILVAFLCRAPPKAQLVSHIFYFLAQQAAHNIYYSLVKMNTHTWALRRETSSRDGAGRGTAWCAVEHDDDADDDDTTWAFAAGSPAATASTYT